MATKTKKLTDKDYAEMAADYAANPPTAEELAGPVEVTGNRLKMGRPTKGTERGKTPSTTVRLPLEVREELAKRMEADGVSASEIVRRALVEHFANQDVLGRHSAKVAENLLSPGAPKTSRTPRKAATNRMPAKRNKR